MKLVDIRKNIEEQATDLPSGVIGEYLLRLSVMLSYMGNTISQAERAAYAYKKGLMAGEDTMSDAKAETFMRAEPVWEQYRQARFEYEATVELIRSLKYLKQIRESEMETTVNL